MWHVDGPHIPTIKTPQVPWPSHGVALITRYPFHFHMMGTVSDSFFEDCAVQHSFFRAYTVHGTSSSRVSRNVAYDVSGSAYYLEDGNEVRSV